MCLAVDAHPPTPTLPLRMMTDHAIPPDPRTYIIEVTLVPRITRALRMVWTMR